LKKNQEEKNLIRFWQAA